MGTQVSNSPISRMMDHMDKEFRRPVDQWWLRLRAVAQAVAGEAH